MSAKKSGAADERELAGKVAVVTGSTRGIGRAAVELFAEAGASVVICSRDKAAAEETAREIEKRHGVKVLACTVDILDAKSVDAFMQKIGDTFGCIDMLVNNAGGSSQRSAEGVTRQIQVTDSPDNLQLPPGRFEKMTDDEFRHAFDQKVLGMIRVSRAALPLLRKSEAGSIVNIASTKGLQSPVRVVTSGIVWAAALSFTKGLSFELASNGIRVNAICVDVVITSQTDKSRARWHPDESMDEFVARRSTAIPLRRLGLPNDVAEAILFLASPRSAYITGQCLSADGGGLRSF